MNFFSDQLAVNSEEKRSKRGKSEWVGSQFKPFKGLKPLKGSSSVFARGVYDRGLSGARQARPSRRAGFSRHSVGIAMTGLIFS